MVAAKERAPTRHRTTRVKRPQSNGIVERLHRTLLDEHFCVECRRKNRPQWSGTISRLPSLYPPTAPSNEEKPLDTHDACNRWRCDCAFHAHTSVVSGLSSLPEPFSTGCISALGLSTQNI